MNKAILCVLILALAAVIIFRAGEYFDNQGVQEPLSVMFQHNESKYWPMFRHDIYRTGNIELKKTEYQDGCSVSTSGSNVPEDCRGDKCRVLDQNDTFFPSPIFADSDGDGRDEAIAYYKNTVFKQGWGARKWKGFIMAVRYGIPDELQKLEFGNVSCIMSWQYIMSEDNDEVHTSLAAADLNNNKHPEILFGADDGNAYALYANGSLFWRFKTGEKVRSSPAVDDINNDGNPEVVFGSDDGYFYALYGNGTLMWKTNIGGKIQSSPAIDSNKIYFGSDDGYFYALGNNGKLLWKFKTEEKIRSSPLIYGMANNSEKEIVFGSDDKNIYILNEGGKLLKKYETLGIVRSSPALYENYYAVGSDDGNIYFFNKEELVKQPSNSSIYSTPVSYEKGVLITTTDGKIMLATPKNMSLVSNIASNHSVSTSISVPLGNINGYPSVAGFAVSEEGNKSYPMFSIINLNPNMNILLNATIKAP